MGPNTRKPVCGSRLLDLPCGMLPLVESVGWNGSASANPARPHSPARPAEEGVNL